MAVSSVQREVEAVGLCDLLAEMIDSALEESGKVCCWTSRLDLLAQ